MLGKILFFQIWIVSTLGFGSVSFEKGRPFRLGVITLNWTLNDSKTLASADFSGWGVYQDQFIGAFDEKWVGSYSVKRNRVKWWVEAKSPLATPVAVFDQFVVLGFRDGTIKKLDAESGKEIWSISLESFSPRKPVLSGSTLFVVSASQQLYAIDFASGSNLWLYDGGFPDKIMIHAAPSPLVYGEVVFLGLASGEVHGVDLRSGKLKFLIQTEISHFRFKDVVGQLYVHANKLYISRYDGLIAAHDLEDVAYRKVWQEKVSGVSTNRLGRGKYVVGCTNGDVLAYDLDSGRLLWRAATGQAVSSLILGDEDLYVSGTNGRIFKLDASGGSIGWMDDVAGDIVAEPIIFESGLYYATGLKNIYAYHLNVK